MCEELHLDLLVVTEQGFNNNIMHFKIRNRELANCCCLSDTKGVGTVISSKISLYPHIGSTTIRQKLQSDWVKFSKIEIIGFYRSPSEGIPFFLQTLNNCCPTQLEKTTLSSSWVIWISTSWMLVVPWKLDNYECCRSSCKGRFLTDEGNFWQFWRSLLTSD